MVPQRLNLEGDKLRVGLARLVLTLVEVLRQVLEREALRRMESGTLTADEIERLGMSFMQVKERLHEMSEQFGLDSKDLSVNLGSILGKRNELPGDITLVDVIDRLLNKGVAAAGKVTISVADVDLVVLDLIAVLSGITTLQGAGSQKAVRRSD